MSVEVYRFPKLGVVRAVNDLREDKIVSSRAVKACQMHLGHNTLAFKCCRPECGAWCHESLLKVCKWLPVGLGEWRWEKFCYVDVRMHCECGLKCVIQ